MRLWTSMGADEDEGDDEEERVQSEVIQVDEEVERRGVEADERPVQKLLDPRKPSQSEVESHNLTHLPYRNWCPICVRCRGRDLDHRKAVEEERGVSEYAFDYCFLGDELGFKLVVLVGRERTTGMYFATVVPTKGSIGRFAVDKALDYVSELGDRNSRIIIKRSQRTRLGSKT